MPFDPQNSKIAITLTEFTLLKSADSIFEKYNEPYIVSVAVDSTGKSNPALDFNFTPFPKVRTGGTVTMLGDGHLLYGPKNPGEFVALSVLMMESDVDMRKRGQMIKKVVESKAVDLGIKAVIAAAPGYAAIVGILKELVTFVAGALAEDGDDELFRTEGSFLRDRATPYDINRRYTSQNDFVKVSMQNIPLETSNGQGAPVDRLVL